MTLSHLQRYTTLVDDPAAFLDAAARPLPRAVWTNSLRTTPEAVAAWIGERCSRARPIPWLPGAWRVPPDAAPGRWPEFALGLIHTQEEIALWPVTVLDAQAGERVLDLCAAPGSKTVHIGTRMADEGCIVANEVNWRRMTALNDNLQRLGLTCVVTACNDGAAMPDEAGPFDRILVDAPCTGEGTSRKASRRGRDRPDDWNKMAAVQKGLLRRAVALTRPGGVIVYCTCTYAPEENEAVLDGVDPAQAAIEPIAAVAAPQAAAGIPAWHGRRFRPDVVNAARFWPHHNDTGGFFVARLRRL